MSLFGCPRCHRVTRQLVRVRYSAGLVDHEPELMCEADVAELRELAAAYLEGRVLEDSAQIWAIAIVGVIGNREEPVRAPVDLAPSGHEPRPRRKRVARGGVGV